MRILQKKQRHSLFRKYFMICSFCVISSITILGALLLAFATRYFERDKYQLMERNAVYAAAITAQNYAANGYIGLDKSFLPLVYSIFSRTIDAEFILAKTDGSVIFADNSQTGIDYTQVTVPEDIMIRALAGKYEQTGMMQGIYAEPRYIVGVPVNGLDAPIGVMFVTCSAEAMMGFLSETAKMFLLSAVLVLILAFVYISFITTSMVKPLRQMVAAAGSFSKGDFSTRVPVSGYDEIGQLSMAFNNMASTLATTEGSRRSFVANVSHELKTPMTTIGGFVDGMLDGTIPEEKHSQYLKVVSNEVKRLSRLVHSMLDTARIEAGELEIHPVIFDISEIIRQSVFTFEQMIEEKELGLEGLDADKIMVQADIDLMHQVVYNLIENAVKFVNSGGRLSFFYRVENQTTFVTIRNTGEGIGKEEAAHLFERFYKSDRSRGLNKSGVGLGLHIVRSIINYHQGEIVVRSVEGEYAEFEFSIPAAPK